MNLRYKQLLISFRKFAVLLLLAFDIAAASSSPAARNYHKEIEPILQEFCSDCHADGAKKGNFAFDEFKSDADMLEQKHLWLSVLKYVRADVMPPPNKPMPSAAQRKQIADWIKFSAFDIDPRDTDPGRVTIHRLNRVEYRNTIQDLLGVDYNTEDEFPPDGAGLGLDNIADLLTMSPLVLEKYLKAAEVILDGAFPAEKDRETTIPASAFKGYNNNSSDRLSFNGSPEIVYAFRNKNPGKFRIQFELEVLPPNAGTTNDTTTNICNVLIQVQSGNAPRETLLERSFNGQPKKFTFDFDHSWTIEPHSFFLVVSNPNRPPNRGGGFGGGRPAFPPAPQLRINHLKITSERTAQALRYFPANAPTSNASEIKAYIRRGLEDFALHAYRRPIDGATLDRLTAEIVQSHRESGNLVESLKPTLAKILCSPRFLFRSTQTIPAKRNESWALIDEYSLASRLSYFLWSSMPDDELLALAGKNQLRKNLNAQVKRMLSDQRSQQLVENFSGQWLQTRNIMKWTIVEPAVLKRENKTAPKTLLTDEIRRAMKDETTHYFARILKEDRSVLEFIDSDYTYLNEALANYYGITNVTGSQLQLVKLPVDSPRGGALTHGSALVVTSNANRTSAVKRGVFVLETFLGLRPADPPPDIPSLESASSKITDHEPTFRESLELHRADPQCASCHKLMDPIGFGLDNFNAMGLYRETEFGQKIDAAGKLASGEEFNGIRELKQILKTSRRQDVYRCLTEKLMTYALGRGLEYYDTETVDQIVSRLEKDHGRFSTLLMGIVDSAPFQKRRVATANSR